MKHLLHPYGFIALFIFGWWCLAFKPSTPLIPFDDETFNSPPSRHFVAHLSPLDRNSIQEALSGDLALMAKLIADWDLDAQILLEQGVGEVRRLSRNIYFRSQLLGRQLTNSTSQQLQALREQARSRYVTDDKGVSIKLHKPLKRFLPQTYVAASFLLALTEPEQIVALPSGIRQQKTLYNTILTEKIPLNCDPYHTEALYNMQPDIAFTSHYSDAATMRALRNQGTHLFTVSKINSLPEIQDALIRIGNVINRPLEAELLALFMDAAMQAIDNRMIAYYTFSGEPPKHTLFLNHFMQYSVPTKRTLTGQLLARIGVVLPHQQEKWMVPVDLEEIIHFNPDCLIIATANETALKRQIQQDPIFSQLPAIRNKRLYFVDQDIQKSPSQYIVLAYYDLTNALLNNTL